MNTCGYHFSLPTVKYMLSFDITDRNVRIIRGNESGGRIKVTSSKNIELIDGIIVNGYIKDIPQLATVIGAALKYHNIKSKDAVISISSTLIVFKELHVPKSKDDKLKPSQFKTMIQNQMYQAISLTDEYCIAYTVADDFENGGAQFTRVFATACPRTVIDCYKRLFSMLSISLKSAVFSCNCISRIILADEILKSQMPFMLVKVDTNLVNINLYENGQLQFSRYAPISKDNYEDKSDYTFEAVYENIFRMLQFQRSRRGDIIQNVIFYGDTSEFIHLSEALQQTEISASLLSIPMTVSGLNNSDYPRYANALGAMLRQKKNTESTNLLEADAGTTNQVKVSNSSLGLHIGMAFGIGALIIGSAYAWLSYYNKAQQIVITKIDNYCVSRQNELAQIDTKTVIVEKLTAYKDKITLAKSGFDSNPTLRTEVFSQIDSCLSGTTISGFSYSSGQITLECIAPAQDIPSVFTQRLFTETKNIAAIGYAGYSKGEISEGEAPADIAIPDIYAFTLLLQLKGDAALTDINSQIQINHEIGGAI